MKGKSLITASAVLILVGMITTNLSILPRRIPTRNQSQTVELVYLKSLTEIKTRTL